jgi:hypothetical protein
MKCPLGIPRLAPGDATKFRTDHVIDIDWSEREKSAEEMCSHREVLP